MRPWNKVANDILYVIICFAFALAAYYAGIHNSELRILNSCEQHGYYIIGQSAISCRIPKG